MTPTPRRASLVTQMTRRLFWIAGLVTMANLIFVALFDASDRAALISDVATRELGRIAAALPPETMTSPMVDDDVRALYTAHPQAYGFLILNGDGDLLDGENTQLIPTATLQDTLAGDDWIVRNADDSSVAVVASRIVVHSGQSLRLFFAMQNDPADLIGDEILDEFVGHVWVPLIPIAILLIGGTYILIRRSLAPVSRAAAWAQSVEPGQPLPPLEEPDMPAEIADLTEATERAVARLNSELAAEQRRAAEAAHALRTPVAVLVARADSLPDSPESSQIRADINALSRTVTQLLTASGADRIEIGTTETVNLSRVVTDTVADLAPFALLHGAGIEVTGAEAAINVFGNRDAIQLALTNLIENAVLHGGGTPVRVDLAAGGCVTVTDQGPGLPLDHDCKVFEPFWRGAGAKPGGAGLGLAIIDRIQRAHGGTVEAGNVADGGAVFRLTYRPV